MAIFHCHLTLVFDLRQTNTQADYNHDISQSLTQNF